MKNFESLVNVFLNKKVNSVSDFNELKNQFQITTELLPLLLKEDDTGCNLIYYSCLEKRKDFIEDLFLTHSNEFKSLSPLDLQSVLWESENAVHKIIRNFYGEGFYQEIKKSNPLKPLNYFLENIGLHLKSDYFKNIENLYKLDKNHESPELCIALFANNDIKKTKKALLSKRFALKEGSTIRNFLNIKEINLLMDVLGKEETGEIVGNYLEAKNQFHSESNLTRIRGEKSLIYFLNLGIDLKDKSKELLTYVSLDKDILLYSIITKKIPMQVFIEAIDNNQLKIEANHHFLNELLKEKSNSKTLKI